VIAVGILVSAVAAFAGLLWANRFMNTEPDGEGAEELKASAEEFETLKAAYGKLPSPLAAFSPIFVPILLICLGSIAAFPSKPMGEGMLFSLFHFLGQPLNALMIGLGLSLLLLKGDNKVKEFSDRISQGLAVAAPILLITGAGGAFGAVIKATPIGDFIGTSLSALGIGIFMPFLVAAALKSAQGSSTVALVATSALVAPMLGDIGLGSEMGRVLTVMAIGAGAMTVSHANDSFFWVVTQFSRMSVAQAYRAQTMATLIQGITAIIFVWLLSLVLL
jgi:GntP family gluconate:H+ symporter